MSYTVPAYTEISHFRAPYKNSFMGFGAARADSTSSSRPSIKVGAEGKSFGIGGNRPLPKNAGKIQRPAPKKKGGFTFQDSSGKSTRGGGGGTTGSTSGGGGGTTGDQTTCPENSIIGQSGGCECIEGFAPDAAGEICVKAAAPPPPPPPPPSQAPPLDKAGMSSAVPYVIGAALLGGIFWYAMTPKKVG